MSIHTSGPNTIKKKVKHFKVNQILDCPSLVFYFKLIFLISTRNFKSNEVKNKEPNLLWFALITSIITRVFHINLHMTTWGKKKNKPESCIG